MRTVIVTGSASGIGQVTAEKLSALGDRVIGVDLHNADINVDLTTDIGRTNMVDQVRELTGGKIDAIIANAGLAAYIPATFSVNVFGAIATLEGLRPMLAGAKEPRAAITSSMASLQPADEQLVQLGLDGDEPGAMARAAELVKQDLGHLIYPSSKVAITRWMRRVASGPDWAGEGIPLNAIGPGVVETAMTADMIDTEEGRANILEIVPMPLNSVMGPQVPAHLLVQLIAEENTHMCGQVLFVDGGYDATVRGESAW